MAKLKAEGITSLPAYKTEDSPALAFGETADTREAPFHIGLFGAVHDIKKANLIMKNIGGGTKLEAVMFMMKMNINPLAFLRGKYKAQTIAVANGLADSGVAIEDLTIYSLGDTETTLREYGPIFAAAREIAAHNVSRPS